jgi:hypothetical protein
LPQPTKKNAQRADVLDTTTSSIATDHRRFPAFRNEQKKIHKGLNNAGTQKDERAFGGRIPRISVTRRALYAGREKNRGGKEAVGVIKIVFRLQYWFWKDCVFFLKCSNIGYGVVWFSILRACSVSTQSMWIEWDWMSLNPKQVKLLLNFFQSHPIHVYWE